MRLLRMFFAVPIVFSLLHAASYGDAGFTQATSPFNPGAATLVYDPGTGNYAVTGGGYIVTVWDHRDMNGLFNCSKIVEGTLSGLFDGCDGDSLFKLDADGFADGDNTGIWPFGGFEFGHIILPPDLTFDEINSIGMIAGSYGRPNDCGFGSGNCDLTYLFIVPEPSAAALLLIGALVLMRRADHIRMTL